MSYDHHHPTPNSECPSCRYQVDGAAGDHRLPEPGDFSLCLKCAAVLQFTDTMMLRQVTEGELAAMDLETYGEIMTLRSAIVRNAGQVRGPSRKTQP